VGLGDNREIICNLCSRCPGGSEQDRSKRRKLRQAQHPHIVASCGASPVAKAHPGSQDPNATAGASALIRRRLMFKDAPNGVTLMRRIAMLFVAILPIAVTVSKVEASYCGQTFDVAAARNRWAVARRTSVDAAHDDESCRAYGNQFFEAVTHARPSPSARTASIANELSRCSTPRSTPLTTCLRRSAAARDMQSRCANRLRAHQRRGPRRSRRVASWLSGYNFQWTWS
jgi:hypothetical protein